MGGANSNVDATLTATSRYIDEQIKVNLMETSQFDGLPGAEMFITNAINQKLSKLGIRSLDELYGVPADDFREAVDRLVPYERFMVNIYTGHAFGPINNALRAGANGDPVLIDAADDLAESISKLPAYKGEVYRAVAVESITDPVANLIRQRYRVGEIIDEPAFTSSSLQDDLFRGAIKFIINSRNGRVVGPMSAHADEREILFAPGTRFKVVEVENGIGPNKMGTNIFLEEL